MRGMKIRSLFGAGAGWNILAKSVSWCHTFDMDYQHEQHTVHLIVYHLIWCPKRRRKILVGPIHGGKAKHEQKSERTPEYGASTLVSNGFTSLFAHGPLC